MGRGENQAGLAVDGRERARASHGRAGLMVAAHPVLDADGSQSCAILIVRFNLKHK